MQIEGNRSKYAIQWKEKGGENNFSLMIVHEGCSDLIGRPTH